MRVMLPSHSCDVNRRFTDGIEVNLETLNSNTLEFLEMQCKNILTARKITNPPEGTVVLERINDEGKEA